MSNFILNKSVIWTQFAFDHTIKRRSYLVFNDLRKCPPQKTIDHSFGLEKHRRRTALGVKERKQKLIQLMRRHGLM
jgi:hypothetical protein